MFSFHACEKFGGKYFRIVEVIKVMSTSSPFIVTREFTQPSGIIFKNILNFSSSLHWVILFTFICDSKNSSLRVLNRPTERRTAPRFLTDRIFFLRLGISMWFHSRFSFYVTIIFRCIHLTCFALACLALFISSNCKCGMKASVYK